MKTLFWKNKRVLITGHTGFKGSWLSLWLHLLGAKTYGFALPPFQGFGFYRQCKIDQLIGSTLNDIRDADAIDQCVKKTKPEIIIHMAAQPYVKEGYLHPKETYETNMIGLINLLETARKSDTLKVFLNVTTDKCYQNQKWDWEYRENDQLGGDDPYSSSKACAEMISHAYQCSYMEPKGTLIARARAGNVIGGGDHAPERLIPDLLRALEKKQTIYLRNPDYIRPWQHVFDCLHGYLLLCQKLYETGPSLQGAWNFAPHETNRITVRHICEHLINRWQSNLEVKVAQSSFKETAKLRLSSAKARLKLNWKPQYTTEQSLNLIVDWHKAYLRKVDMQMFSCTQIEHYMKNIVK
ncbi:MAG: CDP-glucose 4,6-dehydratase [Pseudomonadota bacterium]